MIYEGHYTSVVDENARIDSLPQWFPGVKLNYVEMVGTPMAWFYTAVANERSFCSPAVTWAPTIAPSSARRTPRWR